MRLTLTLAATIGVLASPAIALATPILINGDFEAVASPGQVTLTSVNAPGWTDNVGNGFPLLERGTAGGCAGTGYEGAGSGCQYVILGGIEDGGSWLQQTVAGFTVGDTYTLSWEQATEYDWQVGQFNPATVTLQVLGNATQTFLANSPGNHVVQYWGNWTPESATFVADAATLSFRFSTSGTNSAGQVILDAGLDNVSLQEVGASAVPEPATLLLLGSGLTYAWRRRKTSKLA